MSDMIPFGKYKGQPIEVLEHDPQYADWIAQQQWAKERYPQIVNIIINKFGESEETPDHNAMQAKFMSKTHCALLAEAIGLFQESASWNDWFPIDYGNHTGEMAGSQPDVINKLSQLISDPIHFERKAVDVTFGAASPFLNQRRYEGQWAVIKAELKPIVSDDYPAVLRQMRNNGSNVLVYITYQGVGVPEETFRAFFATQKIRVVSEREILQNADEREKNIVEKINQSDNSQED